MEVLRMALGSRCLGGLSTRGTQAGFPPMTLRFLPKSTQKSIKHFTFHLIVLGLRRLRLTLVLVRNETLETVLERIGSPLLTSTFAIGLQVWP